MEQQHAQGRQRQAGHQLGLQGLAQGAGEAPAPGGEAAGPGPRRGGFDRARIGCRGPIGRRARQHQHQHGAEGEPEAWLHQGPGVGRGHAGRGHQAHQQRWPTPAGLLQTDRQRQHAHGALGRHAPARQQGISQGQCHAGPAAGPVRRNHQAQAHAAPPQRPRRRRGQAGEQGDVQAADAHQVGHAGLPEHLPQRAFDGGLVAHRQRRQHTGTVRVGHRQQQAVTPALPGRFDLHHRRPGVQRRQQLRLLGRAGAHCADAADALLEQPELGIKALRVEHAVRLLEPQRQGPALPGLQGRRRAGEQGVLLPAAAPAQPQPGRQRLQRARRIVRRSHLEDKTQAVGRQLRHADHPPGDLQVHAFQIGAQPVGQTLLGAPGGLGAAQGGQGQRGHQPQAQAGCPGPPARGHPAQPPGHAEQAQPRQQGEPARACARTQRRLLQLHGDASQPGQRRSGDRCALPSSHAPV